MPPLKEQKPTLPRTTAQSWARLEKINEKIAALNYEKEEITATLEAALKNTQ